jgi:hypothetical protein
VPHDGRRHGKEQGQQRHSENSPTEESVFYGFSDQADPTPHGGEIDTPATRASYQTQGTTKRFLSWSQSPASKSGCWVTSWGMGLRA